MENVNIKIKNQVLTITIDLSKNLGPSKSGKSTIIASSYDGRSRKWGKEILQGVQMMLTVYKEKKI